MGPIDTNAGNIQGMCLVLYMQLPLKLTQIGSSAKPAIPSDTTADAQDFLTRTFEIDHETRPSAFDLLQHPWIARKS